MTYSQPGQYPGYPQYPGAGQMPVATRPPVPSTVQNAFYLMVAGAVLALVGPIVTISQKSTIRTQVISKNPDFSVDQVNSAVNVAVGAAVGGAIIGIALWLWMAFANRAGKNYARITSTVFFGLDSLGLLAGLALSAGSAGSVKTSGVSVAVGVVTWLIGLAAIILLWNKQSSDYFKPQQAYGYGYPQQPPPQQYPYPPMQPGQQQPPYDNPPPMQPPSDPWSTNPPRQ
jgi:hypothetical protein